MEFFNILEQSSMDGILSFQNKQSDLEKLREIAKEDMFLSEIVENAFDVGVFDDKGMLPKNSNLNAFFSSLTTVYSKE